MTEAALDAQLDALAWRGDALRAQALRLTFAGLVALVLAGLAYVADPAGNDAFHTYLAVPDDYQGALRAAGASLVPVPRWLLANGGRIPWQIMVTPLAVIAAHHGLRRFVPSRTRRIGLILISLYLFFSVGNPVLAAFTSSGPKEVQAVRIGVIVAQPGRAAAAIDGVGNRLVQPLVLRPDPVNALRGDEARYMLAQQAYLEGHPAAVASMLRALTGQWQPQDGYTRKRIAILVGYAAANDVSPGSTAEALGSAWHPYLRRATTLILLTIAAMIALAGVVLDLAGRRRTVATGRLRRRIDQLNTEVGASFGRSAAPAFGRAGLRSAYGEPSQIRH